MGIGKRHLRKVIPIRKIPKENPRPRVEGSCAHPSTSPSGTFSKAGNERLLTTGLSDTACLVSSSMMPPLRSLASLNASPNGLVLA